MIFFIPVFRQIVYQATIQEDDSKDDQEENPKQDQKKLLFALQKLLTHLQLFDDPADARNLEKALRRNNDQYDAFEAFDDIIGTLEGFEDSNPIFGDKLIKLFGITTQGRSTFTQFSLQLSMHESKSGEKFFDFILKCSVSIKASIRGFEFVKLPPVLMIKIARTQNNKKNCDEYVNFLVENA